MDYAIKILANTRRALTLGLEESKKYNGKAPGNKGAIVAAKHRIAELDAAIKIIKSGDIEKAPTDGRSVPEKGSMFLCTKKDFHGKVLDEVLFIWRGDYFLPTRTENIGKKISDFNELCQFRNGNLDYDANGNLKEEKVEVEKEWKQDIYLTREDLNQSAATKSFEEVQVDDFRNVTWHDYNVAANITFTDGDQVKKLKTKPK